MAWRFAWPHQLAGFLLILISALSFQVVTDNIYTRVLFMSYYDVRKFIGMKLNALAEWSSIDCTRFSLCHFVLFQGGALNTRMHLIYPMCREVKRNFNISSPQFSPVWLSVGRHFSEDKSAKNRPNFLSTQQVNRFLQFHHFLTIKNRQKTTAEFVDY